MVTWEQIGNVATRPGQLAVENVPTNGGAWAPTIRQRDGIFHLVITDAMGRGTLHFTATDPAGPWSDGVVLADDAGNVIEGIDPDLAWDHDGVAYITYSGLCCRRAGSGAHRGIEQVRVDLESDRVLTDPRALWSGIGGMFPEAPHLYQRGRWWYLVVAEGGTERGHGVSIARSTSPEGPFTPGPANPFVTARGTDRPVQNTGTPIWSSVPTASSYLVLLGVRPRGMVRAFSALGRETFVTAARWTADGWLEVEPVRSHRVRADRGSTSSTQRSSRPIRIAVRRFPADVGALSERPGWLVLHADGSRLNDHRPVFVGRRQEHLRATSRALVDISAGTGGLAVRYDERFHVGIEAGDGALRAHVNLGGLEQEWSEPFDGDEIELFLRKRRPEDTGGFPRTSDVIEMGAVVNGEEHVLAEIDGRFLSSEVTESFTGRVVGVFATRGTVAVDWFAYEGDDE